MGWVGTTEVSQRSRGTSSGPETTLSIVTTTTPAWGPRSYRDKEQRRGTETQATKSMGRPGLPPRQKRHLTGCSSDHSGQATSHLLHIAAAPSPYTSVSAAPSFSASNCLAILLLATHTTPSSLPLTSRCVSTMLLQRPFQAPLLQAGGHLRAPLLQAGGRLRAPLLQALLLQAGGCLRALCFCSS